MGIEHAYATTIPEFKAAQEAGIPVQWRNSDGEWEDSSIWGFNSAESRYRIAPSHAAPGLPTNPSNPAPEPVTPYPAAEETKPIPVDVDRFVGADGNEALPCRPVPRYVVAAEPDLIDDNPPPRAAESGTKPTNPKDAIGNRKLQLSLLPFAFQSETALALTDGKYKYGAHNWTIGGVRASIYIDALLRHVARYNAGQTNDPESGVHNLGHAGACLAILLDAEARGVLNDDRPPSVKAGDLRALQDSANRLTGLLIDGHVAEGRAPRHWTITDGKGSGDAD